MLSTSKKNKAGDTALNVALNIIHTQAPKLTLIKILTRTKIDFSIKNRYYTTLLEQAKSNVTFFNTTIRHITKPDRLKNLRSAKETLIYLNLVDAYQKAVNAKKVAAFLSDKTTSELFNISLIASCQNHRNTLISLHQLYPTIFSWRNMLEDAQREGFVHAIPFFMSQLALTSDECDYIRSKQKMIEFNEYETISKEDIKKLEGRQETLKSLKRLYNTPENSQVMVAMLKSMLRIKALSTAFPPEVVRLILEFHE